MILWILISVCMAGDVWRSDHENGRISFSDSPPQDGSFFRFSVDGDPPEVQHVNVKNFPLLDTWDPLIVAAADKYKVDKALIKAVILAESGMDPGARSRSGARIPSDGAPDRSQGGADRGSAECVDSCVLSRVALGRARLSHVLALGDITLSGGLSYALQVGIRIKEGLLPPPPSPRSLAAQAKEGCCKQEK